MKQILQNLSSGATSLAEVPAPRPGPTEVLIETRRSLLSAGTERMLVDFGRAGWISKARQKPEKVRQVMEKVSTDGVAATLDAVRSKLDQPIALGYCNVGVVHESGTEVTGFNVGDRVVSNGRHAEVVSVPATLCARIPEAVSDDEAAFTVIGSIGLQGVRLAQPTLGECFVVFGLGLIGLLTVQVLRAHGCRVMGVDMDASKLALAEQFGAETVDLSSGADALAAAERFSRGRGVDGVLLTLTSSSDEPVSTAARMCRKRGRVVLVGVTGLNLQRADFYDKEISFQVSCSYGPGRYDPEYEEKGRDYPVGFVRWTEQRNFEAFLDMMAEGCIDVMPLISHRYPFQRATEAYDLLVSEEPSLGIILEYETQEADVARTRSVPLGRGDEPVQAVGQPRVAFIGAGNYAGRVLIPAFREAGARFGTVVTESGIRGVHYGAKHKFRHASTDVEEALSGADEIVAIATRHDTHADLVARALRHGKHAFVEKPLALTREELRKVEAALGDAPGQLLMVGFNRRFAPHVRRIQSLIGGLSEPKAFVMTVNAGSIPLDHWTQDPQIGGGRIVGEACHFIDLLRHLAGAPMVRWDVTSMVGQDDRRGGDDRASITLRFADGSFGTIHYLANGHKAFPKERLEVFVGGRVLQLDNFRRLRGYGWKGFRRMALWRQDKGQRASPGAFLEAVRSGGRAPIPHHELLEVSRVSIDVAEAARYGSGSSATS